MQHELFFLSLLPFDYTVCNIISPSVFFLCFPFFPQFFKAFLQTGLEGFLPHSSPNFQ